MKHYKKPRISTAVKINRRSLPRGCKSISSEDRHPQNCHYPNLRAPIRAVRAHLHRQDRDVDLRSRHYCVVPVVALH